MLIVTVRRRHDQHRRHLARGRRMISVVAAPAARSHLISRSATSADVLARITDSPSGPGRPGPSREALRQLRDGAGDLTLAVTGDGHFQWILTCAGRVVAESPPVHRDAVSCRRAFTEAQHAAALALGEPAVTAQ
jgi:hypothetical protein